MQLVLIAQTSINGAGGEATGIGGKMSFSIGEVAYTSISTLNFTITQGIQQPYISPFNYSVNASDYNVCAGQAVTLSVNTVGSYRAGTVHCNATPTAVVDVTNPITGKTWMDRNLGASQVATSSTDAEAYGDLYQWGRGADGHQCRNSATTTTLSSSDQPGHGDFIINSADWLIISNNTLWQVINGSNNPCPIGYRIPTETELSQENVTNLNLTMGGYRSNSSGALFYAGTTGRYWSSTLDSLNNGRFLSISSYATAMSASYRIFGCSVRCIKD